MAVLKLLKGQASRESWELGDGKVVLGRDPKCDICLEPEEVSREHAEILKDGATYYVVDTDSRNYTYLNGTRLEPNVRFPLQHNDLVKICSLIFAFSDHHTDSRDTGGHESNIELVDDAIPGATSEVTSRFESSSSGWHQRIGTNAEAKLRAIMQITRDLHNALELDQVLAKVLESLLRIFDHAQSAMIVLLGPDKEQPQEPRLRIQVENSKVRVARFRIPAAEKQIFVSHSVIRHVLESERAIITDDVRMDPRFSTSQSVSRIERRSVMCAPLLDLESGSLGVLQLDSESYTRRFQEADLDLLSTVALQVSLAVEDSMLHEQALRQRELQLDLEVAREIQLGLLPSGSPNIEGYEFYDFYAPAKQVGGDYYDYLPMPDGRLGIVIGDVAGKGVAAAMLMAKLSTEMKVRLASGLGPVETFAQVNKSFSERTPHWRFVTAVLLVLDPTTHEIQMVNAGHMRPILRKADGGVSEIGSELSGLPLGVAADHEHQECRFTLDLGEILVLYSDGVSDALNDQGKTLTVAGLHTLVGGPADSVTAFGQRLIDALHAFVGRQGQTDDICFLSIGRKPTATRKRTRKAAGGVS